MLGLDSLAIEAYPGILGGKPVIQGTRIPVDLILELVDAGLDVDDVLREYSHLKKDDVLMVLQVARKAHETVRYERLRSTTETRG